MHSKLLNYFLIVAFSLILVSCGGGNGGSSSVTDTGASIKTGFESTNGVGIEIKRNNDGSFQYVDYNGKVLSSAQLPSPLSEISASDANGMYMDIFSKYASSYNANVSDIKTDEISDSVADYINASGSITESLKDSIETNSLEIAAVAKIITEAFVNNITNAVVAPSVTPQVTPPVGGGSLPGGMP